MELAAKLASVPFGALAGILHAWLLWKGRGTALARIGLVGGSLLGAALAGALLPVAAGWFAGFVGTAALLVLRGAR